MVRATAAAGLAGFACMAAELTAVRVLAPHFGDSAYVWTNVIGVILGALAAGAWFGGRLAGRDTVLQWPTRLLVASGVLLAIVPLVAGPLGSWLLPEDLPLDAAMPAIVRGSFAATVLLFAPPLFLLGAVSPLLVTGLALGRIAVGRAAGSVGAASTVGSLVGTFAATHWLVPEVGCRIALALAGAVLVLAGLLVAGAGRVRAALGAVVLAVAATSALHSGPLRPAPSGRELLTERESRTQFLQVQADVDAEGRRRTLLVINEGLDSFHSLAVEGSVFTGGNYYDWHGLAPLLVGDGQRPGNLRALSIGDAAGSLRAVYKGVHPEATVDAVDIDPVCMQLGREFFSDAKASGGAYVLDGRVFLERARTTWHVIHVDAYAHQVYVPAHLASREFFEAARQRLEPNGIIACNVGGLYADDPVLRAIGSTMGAVFGHALAFQVPNTRNFLLLSRRGAPPEPAALSKFVFGEERLDDADRAHWVSIVETASNADFWSQVGEGRAPLVDDRPVLDRLLLASYVDRTEPTTVEVCRGPAEPAGAEVEAYRRHQARDWPGVLRAVAGSKAATAYLRELAGDARWHLRQLRTAALEYEAAQALTTDAVTIERLRGRLAAANREVEPLQHAEATAGRNGQLQVGLGACILVLLWLLRRVA
ncbi:MAG: fused MFS/spermidine synthase [Planctomycetota bacterium]